MIQMITRFGTTRINVLLMLAAFFLTGKWQAQSSFTKDVEYIDFLIKNNQPLDAVFFLNQVDSIKTLPSLRDSIHYFYGLAFHHSKKTDSAALYFGRVSRQSLYFEKSRFFRSLNNMYALRYDEAFSDISEVKPDSSVIQQQQKIQLCGLSLLKRDHAVADSISKSFDYASHLYSEEQRSLVQLSERALKVSNKKPYKAALLSAIVPGLGKYYAGRRGQAVASFFTSLSLGLLAGESYYRGGLKSPQFIIAGSLFSVFYFGNIVGSGYSVRMVKKKNKELLDYEIKSTVHRSLRRIYN